jgi:hypothetical protein
MDEIFTMKSDTSINGGRKRNNAQIVSTLRSEIDTDNNLNYKEISNLLKNTTNVTSPINTTKDDQTYHPQYVQIRKNGIEILQEDIVSIAESIHNLVKMLDEQREKMNSVEKEVSKIGIIENEISKINENFKNTAESAKQNSQKTSKQKEKEKENLYTDSSVYNNDTTTSLPTKVPNKKSIILYKQKKIISSNCPSKSTSKTETITDSCIFDSKSQSICEYNNSKEVDEKLNNITKGFNTELLNMKRKQALLAASYVKINKMR